MSFILSAPAGGIRSKRPFLRAVDGKTGTVIYLYLSDTGQRIVKVNEWPTELVDIPELMTDVLMARGFAEKEARSVAAELQRAGVPLAASHIARAKRLDERSVDHLPLSDRLIPGGRPLVLVPAAASPGAEGLTGLLVTPEGRTPLSQDRFDQYAQLPEAPAAGMEELLKLVGELKQALERMQEKGAVLPPELTQSVEKFEQAVQVQPPHRSELLSVFKPVVQAFATLISARPMRAGKFDEDMTAAHAVLDVIYDDLTVPAHLEEPKWAGPVGPDEFDTTVIIVADGLRQVATSSGFEIGSSREFEAFVTMFEATMAEVKEKIPDNQLHGVSLEKLKYVLKRLPLIVADEVGSNVPIKARLGTLMVFSDSVRRMWRAGEIHSDMDADLLRNWVLFKSTAWPTLPEQLTQAAFSLEAVPIKTQREILSRLLAVLLKPVSPAAGLEEKRTPTAGLKALLEYAAQEDVIGTIALLAESGKTGDVTGDFPTLGTLAKEAGFAEGVAAILRTVASGEAVLGVPAEYVAQGIPVFVKKEWEGRVRQNLSKLEATGRIRFVGSATEAYLVIGDGSVSVRPDQVLIGINEETVSQVTSYLLQELQLSGLLKAGSVVLLYKPLKDSVLVFA